MNGTVHAFQLSDEVKEDFAGGTVSCGPSGHMLDIKQALDQGEGTILTSDPGLIELLRAYPALQEAEAPAEVGVEKLTFNPSIEATTRTVEQPWIPQHNTSAPEIQMPEVPAEHLDPDAAQDPQNDPTGGEASTSPAGDELQADESGEQSQSARSASRSKSRTGQSSDDS